MTMHDQTYALKVRQLELDAEQHPEDFRRRVLWISAVAYLVLALMFVALLGIIGAVVWYHDRIRSPALLAQLGLVGLSVLSLLFVTLRAFLTPIPPPEGLEITAHDAPQLFKQLEHIRQKLQGPPIHAVLVDHEFNAAIAQAPRFGLFGGYRNYLILGLPFLYAVSPREMLGILAHEYGHLTGEHGKLTAWIYRQRYTFIHLHATLRARSKSILYSLLFRVLDRFFPYYDAYTFVLSRQQEYEADAASSRIVGAEASASGLIRSALVGRWLSETFWPTLYARAADHRTPPFLPFSSMPMILSGSHPEWATPEWLEQSRRKNSDLHDTHPCLRHRVNALEQSLKLPAPLQNSAAEILLGQALTRKLAQTLDQQWWQGEQKQWRQYHTDRQNARQRINELRPQPASQLSLSELQELAQCFRLDEKIAEAKKVLDYLLKKPGGPFPRAHWLYATLLLEEENPAALEHLYQAAMADPDIALDCARLGYHFLCETEDEAAAEAWVSTLPHLEAQD